MMPTIKPATRPENDEANSVGSGPHFFLVGCPRSGLTRIGRLLDAHPLLAVAPDVSWITECYETRAGLNLQGCLASEPVAKWLELGKFELFEIPKEDIKGLIAPGQFLGCGEFLTRFFDLFAKARGKHLVGSITPSSAGFMPMIPLLHTFWPRAKFIHLIRDGRDVCLSVLNRQEPALQVNRYSTWADDPVSTGALWWRHMVQQGRQAGRELAPEIYCETRYESLVADPICELRALCAFLGVAYDPAILEGRASRNAWPIRSKLRYWPTQMPPKAVERFETACATFLDELGYVRGSSCPEAATLDQVNAVKERFNQESRPPWLSRPALARRRLDMGATNPFVFIVGCPRSGTTLLQRILDAHSQVAIANESFWIPYFFKKRLGVTPEGIVTSELPGRLFAYYKFYGMKAGPEDIRELLRPGEQVSYGRFVAGLFDLYADFRGKPLAGDKTPDYVRNIPTLAELWPKAKFVHLIRDGRDVCLSVLNWRRKAARFATLFPTWREEPVATAAAWWNWHVRRGRENGDQLGPERYYEVRYEALVANPTDECTRLCAFLGLPYQASMLRFHEGRSTPGADPGKGAKDSWLPITPGLRDWRTQMRPEDIECYEAVAGPLLKELGFSRAAACPRPELLARAAVVGDRFAENTRLLGDWLP
jgi:hypothetical protein